MAQERLSYEAVVKYESFRDAVLELADDDVRLTKARVAERLSIEPSSAGELLDRMAREGALELDIDERSGEIFYEPTARGARASKKPALAALGDLGAAIDRGKLAAKVGAALALADDGASPLARRRKVSLGVLLGGLIPGLGLAYAAPWTIVVAASAVVLIGFELLSIIPVVSSLLLVPFLVVCALGSAALGGLYTWRYNQAGKRAALGREPTTLKGLLKRRRSTGD